MEGKVDQGLCHGAGGIAHIFGRLYQYTGDTIFKDAAVVWFRRVMLRWQPGRTDGFAGFLSTHFNQPMGSVGLLRGTAGVALSLLGGVSDLEPAWDRVLLISP
jgi:lantibiotic modifying enzyme